VIVSSPLIAAIGRSLQTKLKTGDGCSMAAPPHWSWTATEKAVEANLSHPALEEIFVPS